MTASRDQVKAREVALEDLIHLRGSVDDAESVLSELIFELANPEISRTLSPDSAREWSDRLHDWSHDCLTKEGILAMRRCSVNLVRNRPLGRMKGV